MRIEAERLVLRDYADAETDIGYEVAPRLWGQGYATEAEVAMVDFGFRELGLHRIPSWGIADNTASAPVLDKVGFRLEGRLRQNERFKGRRWDTLLYGLLREEWPTLSPPSPPFPPTPRRCYSEAFHGGIA